MMLILEFKPFLIQANLLINLFRSIPNGRIINNGL